MNYIFFVLAILYALNSNAQSSGSVIEQPDSLKELMPGDKMPDLPFGNMFPPLRGKNSFGDLKGKLVILDFWESFCSSCISGFPLMKRLQDRFSKDVQIILVNTTETKSTVYKRKKDRFSMPDLPCIYNATDLGKLFPRKFAGATVWLGADGRVFLKGHTMNNNIKKIQEVLSGTPISYIPDPKPYNGERYSTPCGKHSPLISGNLYPFDFDFGPTSGRSVNKKDSSALSTRTTFINTNLLQMLLFVFVDELRPMTETRLRPKASNALNLDLFELNVKDTLNYTASFIPEEWKDSLRTDINWAKSIYCYEQILPYDADESLIKRTMLRDINTLLSARFGEKATLEKRYITGYCITRTQGRSKLDLDRILAEDTLINDKSMVRCDGRNLFLAITRVIPIHFLGEYQLIDRTGYSGYVDLLLPAKDEYKSLDDFRQALNQNGLDLVFGKTEIVKIVISPEKQND